MLRVEGLSAHAGRTALVRDVSFAMERGETLAVLGASGSGKSLTGRALIALPPRGIRYGGRVVFDGEDLFALPERALTARRGRDLAMIFQEPATALNPVMRIGAQIDEPLRIHTRLGASERAAKVRLLGAALDRLAARLQAPSQWVDARRAAFHASRPLTFDRWQALTAATPHAGLIRPLDQGWGALIRLGGVSDLPRLQQMVTRQRDAGLDLQWLDTVAQAEASLAAARRDATRVLLLAAMVAGLILVVRYGLLRAAVVAVPPGLAVAVTLGLCGWAQAGFSVFRLFALLLVLGLAIDYAVFAAETVRDRQRTLVAIVLSMLTTLLAFGLLGLSATPALAEFGATVVCGVLVAFVSTLGLWRAGWLGAR